MSEEATLDEFVSDEADLDVSEEDLMTSLDETSVGNIPADWSAVRLGELTENTLYGANESAENYDPNKPRYVRIKDIDEQGRLKKTEKASLSPDKAEGYFLEKGDMLFARSGSPGRTYLHRDESVEYCYGGYSIKHELVSEGLNHEYLSQYTKSQNYWDWIERIARTGAQANINSREYASLLVPLPPLSEQRKIATVLFTVDRAIKKTEQIIEQTSQIKKGVMEDIFSHGVQDHQEFQETKYGTIPKEWEVKTVEEIADRIGSGGTPSTEKSEYYDGDIAWVKTDDLNSGLVDTTKTTITEKGLNESAAKLFPKGTVLFAMYGGALGQNGRLGMEAAMNQACCGIVPDESKMDPYLLHQQLIHRKQQLTALSAGTHQQNISQTMVEKFEIFVPPIEEQDIMADIIQDIESTIQKNITQKEQLQRLKQGLQQDLLSGTVRTTDTNIEVPDEVAQHG